MLAVFVVPIAFAHLTIPVESDAVAYARLIQQATSSQADPKVAADAFQKALKIENRDGDVWTQYGHVLRRLDRDQEAITALTTALNFGGFDNKWEAGIHMDIARCSAKLGKKNDSWRELNIAMERGFRDLASVRTDKDLGPLHENPGWHRLVADADVTKLSRNEGWRYDLWLLNRELRRIHLNPYTKQTPKQFDESFRALDREIPRLTDNQIRLRLVKFTKLVGDGHTALRLQPTGGKQEYVPIQFGFFEDGLYITAAAKPQKQLVGQKIESLGGKSGEELLKIADEYIARDNSMDVLARGPRLLTQWPALDGLGLVSKDGTVRLEVSSTAGARTTVQLNGDSTGVGPDWETVSGAIPGGAPRFLKNRSVPYWMETIPDLKALYFQYNAVREMPQEPVAKFAERLETEFVKNSCETLVVDCRWNGGGNTFLSSPLVNAFISLKALRKPNHLFVIMGRDTFSACQNFITDIGRALQPVYVGEPSGSRPNFIGESIPFTLPYSKMSGTVSDLYWQRSWPMDARNWIPPDLPTPIRFSDLRVGRDAAMDAITEFINSKP